MSGCRSPRFGRLANALLDAGFRWRENTTGWEAVFTKEIDDDIDTSTLDDDVHEIMGDYYAAVAPNQKA